MDRWRICYVNDNTMIESFSIYFTHCFEPHACSSLRLDTSTSDRRACCSEQSAVINLTLVNFFIFILNFLLFLLFLIFISLYLYHLIFRVPILVFLILLFIFRYNLNYRTIFIGKLYPKFKIKQKLRQVL